MRRVVIETERYADLVLPDGTPVESLRVAPLYNVLVALGIPGIEAQMGKQELIGCYEAVLLAKAEARARAENQKWHGPSQAIMHRAARDLGQAS